MNRRTAISIAASLLVVALASPLAGAAADGFAHRPAPAALPPGWAEAAPRIEFISLQPIPFDHDLDTPAETAEALLRDAARFIRHDPHIRRVLIKGFADATAGIDYNDALSRRRAESVRERLVGHGAPAGLLHLSAWGKAAPVDEEWTEAGRSRNRRVEIHIVREP